MIPNTARTAKAVADLEAGTGQQLYPGMLESPQLRWAFIRKVYVILSLQLLLTVGVAATVVFVHPISHFVLHTTPGIAVYVVSLVLSLLLLFPLFVYRDKHPVNLLLLALFTISVAFGVGLSCAHFKGRIILEAAILTSVVVVSLTLYTFWAVKRGHDFQFLWPFLFCSLLVLLVFAFIQILLPLGKLGTMIYSCLAAIVFSAFIIYDTSNLIKRFSYDEYVWAAIALYLDIINLFLALLASSNNN